ncbi:hypothetical protein V6N11_056774 [Hibiscus sabdariffa]|uniref:Uncharacterized protein n=1 Tax=Hibiscus sabdariffa TaxID=183260 RepID=A0ABR2T5M9_9ROSI
MCAQSSHLLAQLQEFSIRFDHSYTGVSTGNKESQDGGGFNNNTGYSQKFEKSPQSYTHVVSPPINQSGFFAPLSHGVSSSFGQPLPGVATYPVSCCYGSPMLPHFGGNPYFSFAGVGSSSGTGTSHGSLPISGENSTGHASSTTPASFASSSAQSSATRDNSCKKESTFASNECDQQGLSLLVSSTQQTPGFQPTSVPFVAPSVSANSIPDQLDSSAQLTNQIAEISGGFQEDEASPREGSSSSVPLEAGSLGTLPSLQVEADETNSAPLVTDFLVMTEDGSQAQILFLLHESCFRSTVAREVLEIFRLFLQSALQQTGIVSCSLQKSGETTRNRGN